MKNKILNFKDGSITLNAAQYEAITHKDGPAMILAGPGSGKTFVIVHRIKFLIENLGVMPSSVLVITFTRSAAYEMQQRFMKITDSSYPEVSFGTFHSIFYQILLSLRSRPGKRAKIDVASESFKIKIMSDIIHKVMKKDSSLKEDPDRLSEAEVYESAKELLSEISRIKNTGEDCEHNPGISFEEHFDEIFADYNRLLKEFGKIDFDDMILECCKELSKGKNAYSDKFKYILIDEYQDINKIQKEAVDLIKSRDCNLFAVGDDDQAIYGFRGSDPGLMKLFYEENKNDIRIIRLEANYRSGASIINASHLVINENKLRFKKSSYAADTNIKDRVYTRRFLSKNMQDAAVVSFINGYRGALSDIAIIFRTNSECLNMAQVLKGFGIPNSLDNRIDESKLDDAVDLCLSYLEFAYLGKKRNDFLKIMNKPLRYISREAASDECVSEGALLKFYKGNRERCEEIKKLFRHINMIAHLRPSLSVRYLIKQVGIDKLYPKSKDNLEKFSEEAGKYNDTVKLIRDYRREEVEKEQNTVKHKTVINKNCVKIYTMHGSKGLEFRYVWLPSLNEGIIPSRSAVSEKETEEERRMLYVGMTRAKEALIMSYITGDEDNKMLPSRFLKPIKHLWDANYKDSESSSGRSMSSSNSTSSR
ncbi:ATP-dependent helicase [Butyrivibrio sp. X503]|uniref:ATP-dependent helicase n=1 Tax=Butyrivibrio sp. X503 TaxID=2364878 RepID=UPI00131484B5|nr:ATP-dependent helicase [Butyrivibrio sp. X503]